MKKTAEEFLNEKFDWLDKSPGGEKLYFESIVIKAMLEYATQCQQDNADVKLKIYKCDFEGQYPVGNCLVLAATNQLEAEKMARETITHATDIVVKEVILDNPKVIEYLSGDY